MRINTKQRITLMVSAMILMFMVISFGGSYRYALMYLAKSFTVLAATGLTFIAVKE